MDVTLDTFHLASWLKALAKVEHTIHVSVTLDTSFQSVRD
jgi:hypothetical protein